MLAKSFQGTQGKWGSSARDNRDPKIVTKSGAKTSKNRATETVTS